MSTTDDVRAQMIADMSELIARRGKTTDDNEKAAIDGTLADINIRLEALDQMSLLQAAGAVSDTSAQLARVVAAARLDPLDRFRERLARSIERLSELQAAMHASEALPPADIPVPAGAPIPPPAPPGPGAPPPPVNSTDYAALKAEYRRLYDSCTTRPEFKANVEYYLKQLNRNRAAYEGAVAGVGTVPWHFVGIIHAMESGFGFATHLHNGDPLTARTVHVPAGRPAEGNPPFDWKTSARDALRFKGYDKETDWSVERTLYLLEKYNGFGYRPIGLPTPYLWSFSNHYSKGKYVEDRKFAPEKVSKQCGAALMMKALGVA